MPDLAACGVPTMALRGNPVGHPIGPGRGSPAPSGGRGPVGLPSSPTAISSATPSCGTLTRAPSPSACLPAGTTRCCSRNPITASQRRVRSRRLRCSGAGGRRGVGRPGSSRSVGVIALLFGAVRFGPPRPAIPRKRRSPLEHVRALATALAAAHGHDVAVATIIRGLAPPTLPGRTNRSASRSTVAGGPGADCRVTPWLRPPCNLSNRSPGRGSPSPGCFWPPTPWRTCGRN